MDRNFIDGIVEDTASAKSVWTVPQIVETDIAAVTAGGTGITANDGTSTSS
ncbi:MAG: hypothetical protein WCS75_11230 [Sphingomonas sp.]|jgi:hypothetical protein|uniref:hypothetical protein n=1 Tax=Sphingomonas sp. TaxID=28214 RepID=UPI003565B959